MLRLALIVLLLANAVMLALNLGWLDRVLGARSSDREPERLARQVNADAVTLLTPQAASAAFAAASAAAAAASAAAAAPQCVEVGPFVGADAAAAEQRIAGAGLAAGSWTAERGGQDGVYLIYMGRYADTETMQRKQAELQRREVAAEPVKDAPELQPGLSLGRFETARAANDMLARLRLRGIRTAHVATLRAETPTLVLRVAAADAAMRERLAALALPAGVAFTRCAEGDVAATAATATSAASSAVASASSASR